MSDEKCIKCGGAMVGVEVVERYYGLDDQGHPDKTAGEIQPPCESGRHVACGDCWSEWDCLEDMREGYGPRRQS